MIHSDVVLHESPELHAHALFNLSMSRLLFNLYVNCCSEPIWLPSNIWNWRCMLLAERFLFVGFQLVLLPRSQLVLLVVTFGVYLSMSSRSAPFNLYRISVPRLVADQVTFPKAYDQRLLVCCSRRIPAQRFCKTARSDHFPSFHLVSSLQLPYIIVQHGLNAGGSSQCFLTRCSDALQPSANYSPVVHNYLLTAQCDCVFNLLLAGNMIQAALDHLLPIQLLYLHSLLFLKFHCGPNSISVRNLRNYWCLHWSLRSPCCLQVPCVR